ncbi:MAG: homoserine dehydrogenase [Planctomycetota bacterium]|nr:homoserine dehydrogenase [Planctomycetota bacterium]
MSETGVAVIGFGTVGCGVVRLLLEDGPRLAKATGCRLVLRHVCDIDFARPRPVAVPKELLTDQVDRIINDPAVSVAVETVGGTTFAVDLMKRLLAAGKDVVTANKAALAKRGPELFEAARKAGRSISFEASVAAGIPIIRAIRDGLVANRITALTGILNGTCNYILTQMSSTGAAYAKALSEAQTKGYAEADPTLDVSGEDTRHKLAILAGLAFGANVNVDDIYLEGIAGIDPADITYGKQLGYTLKLLAVARIVDGAMSLHVHPTFVPASSPVATVSGVNNAVLVTGHAVGDTFYVGPGAGMMPTASSIVADIIDAAIGRATLTFSRMAWLAGRRETVPVQPMADIRSRYYLRFDVLDKPGVLGAIAGVLGHHDISVASVLQHESPQPQGVPVVITTHDAREGNVTAALEDIGRLPVVTGRKVRIRILAPNQGAGA